MRYVIKKNVIDHNKYAIMFKYICKTNKIDLIKQNII